MTACLCDPPGDCGRCDELAELAAEQDLWPRAGD